MNIKFKVLHQSDKVDTDQHSNVSVNVVTKGHIKKLNNQQIRKDEKKFFYSNRVVNE